MHLINGSRKFHRNGGLKCSVVTAVILATVLLIRMTEVTDFSLISNDPSLSESVNRVKGSPSRHRSCAGSCSLARSRDRRLCSQLAEHQSIVWAWQRILLTAASVAAVCLATLMPVSHVSAATDVAGTEDSAAPAPQLPPRIEERSSQRALTVGKALKDRRAIMFGTHWCPFCDKERQGLGSDIFAEDPKTGVQKDGAFVRYIECDPGGMNARRDLCMAAGVNRYPTWALSVEQTQPGQLPYELHPGFKGLRGLERLTNLPSPPAEEDPTLGTTTKEAVAPPITGTSSPQAIQIAKELRSIGATFYGTWWCPACDTQRQLFGKEAWSSVPYVECDGRSAESKPDLCEAAGVEGIPFWVFPNGDKTTGVLTIEALESRLFLLNAKMSLPAKSNEKSSVVLPMPNGVDGCEDCRIDTKAVVKIEK